MNQGTGKAEGVYPGGRHPEHNPPKDHFPSKHAEGQIQNHQCRIHRRPHCLRHRRTQERHLLERQQETPDSDGFHQDPDDRRQVYQPKA